ncbi:MAG: methylated-DNA--[protein]-cysteine S-methyltransferase [Candidatus Eisenbacteria bacterium]|nr:methylated-DNA--[protein]-cysteine S-methyltransferase [Candidatus Eisenbacteria bacterium]
MMADRKPEELIDRYGEKFARFFLLLQNDPLDAEDSFRSLFLRLLDPRSGAFEEEKAYGAAVRLVRRTRSRRERAGYRPVEVEESAGEGGERTAAGRRAWRRLPLPERIAALIRLESGLSPEAVARVLGWEPERVSARIERGLLSFRAAAAGVGGKVTPTRIVPRGALLDLRLGPRNEARSAKTEEALHRSPPLARAQAELDEAIVLVGGLYRSALRAGDWKRMRRRLLRELPGDGAVLRWDRFPSPLGDLYVGAMEGAVVRIVFGDLSEEAWIRSVVPSLAAEAKRDPKALQPARGQLGEYFEGKRRAFTFSWRLIGVSGFQASVLDACARVPFGSVRSYKQIARDVGKSRGMRAVGRALARNPIPVVIPCHRIISHTGRVGGFSGGIFRKEKLLALEGMAGLFTGDAG